MNHIAAIFTIIYRYFSRIEYKKYATYFELILCIFAIYLCVNVYKNWSEVQHFYHGYSFTKLTIDSSKAKLKFDGYFNECRTDTVGLKSEVSFSNIGDKSIDWESDTFDDTLKLIARDVYQKNMIPQYYNKILGVWRQAEYQTIGLFDIPSNVCFNQNSLQYLTFFGDTLYSSYTKIFEEVKDAPSYFSRSISYLPDHNKKGMFVERYYNIHKDALFAYIPITTKSPVSVPVEWYSKGDISQMSYFFVPRISRYNTSIDVMRFHSGRPISIKNSSPLPDVCNEFCVEFTDSAKLADIAQNGLQMRIEFVDNVNLQTYRLYILGALLSIFITLAITLLCTILKSLGFKYSLLWLILPAMIDFLIKLSPLYNGQIHMYGYVIYIWVMIAFVLYYGFIVFKYRGNFKNSPGKFILGVLLSIISSIYLAIIIWIIYVFIFRCPTFD